VCAAPDDVDIVEVLSEAIRDVCSLGVGWLLQHVDEDAVRSLAFRSRDRLLLDE
jgi:hypothetical protein